MIRQRNRLEKKPGQMPEKILVAILLLAPVFEIGLLGFSLWSLFSGVEEAVWLILLAAAALVTSWMDYQAAMAEYSFCPDGVTVQYPLEKQRYYPWSDFQQVCVCYYSRATEMYGYSVICLVKKGEKKDLFGRWKTANPFRYRSVMCLDYSETLLETVRESCPYDVPDLRDKGNYRL